jgi:excisionase family DNA binding protein
MPEPALVPTGDVPKQKRAERPAPEPIGVSVRDAAAMIGIGRTKVYGLIESGELETARIGDRRLVLKKSSDRLMQPVRN